MQPTTSFRLAPTFVRMVDANRFVATVRGEESDISLLQLILTSRMPGASVDWTSTMQHCRIMVRKSGLVQKVFLLDLMTVAQIRRAVRFSQELGAGIQAYIDAPIAAPVVVEPVRRKRAPRKVRATA